MGSICDQRFTCGCAGEASAHSADPPEPTHQSRPRPDSVVVKGVCIHFNGPSLESALRKVAGVKFKEVEYVKINELRKKKPATNELPFIKRFPFQPEKEYRALWESKVKACAALDIAIDLSSITRITLSPWLHPNLRKNLVAALKRIDGCKGIPMWRSTLTENATWKDYGSSAT